MKKKPKHYIDPHRNHIVINGEHYIVGRTKQKKVDGITHIDYYTLEKVNLKEDDFILDEIARKLVKKMSPEKIIREAIKKKLSTNARNRLFNMLREKKVKVKEQDGCYGIVVDGKHFQIFE